MTSHFSSRIAASISTLVCLHACSPFVRVGGATLGIGSSTSSPAPVSASPTEAVSANERRLLLESAELAEIAYHDHGLGDAISRFAAKGYHAAYFASRSWLGTRYPEVFVLAPAHERRVVLVFVGTNSYADWVQNAKGTRYQDVPLPGHYYLLPGHAGFRSGIRRLIHDHFFEATLPGLVHQWGISTGEPVPVRIVGHSMGGGLAVLAAPVVDGVKYAADPASGWVQVPELGRKSGPFRVTEIVALAPAYAVTVCQESRFPHFDHYEAFQREYGARTYSVIRDDDVVPRLTPGFTTTRYQHVGQQIRITRDGAVVREGTSWRGGPIHAITAYMAALSGDAPDPDLNAALCR
jgi:Lipase (class 3)